MSNVKPKTLYPSLCGVLILVTACQASNNGQGAKTLGNYKLFADAEGVVHLEGEQASATGAAHIKLYNAHAQQVDELTQLHRQAELETQRALELAGVGVDKDGSGELDNDGPAVPKSAESTLATLAEALARITEELAALKAARS